MTDTEKPQITPMIADRGPSFGMICVYLRKSAVLFVLTCIGAMRVRKGRSTGPI